MLTIWGYVAYMQRTGAYFFDAYPRCTAFEKSDTLKYEYWGDTYCDPRLYTEYCGMDGGDCNNYCMAKWTNPSPRLWLDVQDTLELERSEDCLFNNELIYAKGENELVVNGFQPIDATAFNYTDLYGEFSKCFHDNSIYATNLGLFCFFGDYTQHFSGRRDVNVEENTMAALLHKKDPFFHK